MSRVMKPNKFVNSCRYDSSITNPSKVTRIKGKNPDYSKARSLTDWLFLKYDMSYKSYRNKSKGRRDQLRSEYAFDTRENHKAWYDRERYAMMEERDTPFMEYSQEKCQD